MVSLLSVIGRGIGHATEKIVLDLIRNIGAGEEGDEKRRKGCIRAWLNDFREHPGGVHLVIGKQRSGKTALCYFLAQKTGRKPIYAMTAATEVPIGVEVIFDIDSIPGGGVCVIDDASLFFDSLRVKGDNNSYKGLRDAVIVSEKQDICFLINVHDSSLLNKAAFSQCKSIIFKEPNLMSLETERPAISKIMQHVQEGFNKISKSQRPNYFFLYSSDCRGWGKAPLPSGWSQKISTSCRTIDAEFTEIDKKEESFGEKPPRKQRKKEDEAESFEEFKRHEKGYTKDNQNNRSSR